MLKVGLTGGIGCGKSTVCDIFRDYAVPVIDTDILARQVVAPGTPVLAELVKRFGGAILREDGGLNRHKLREVVFTDDSKRMLLESVIHPAIRHQLELEIKRLRNPYVIIAIPLLLEKGWQSHVDRILVIDCSPELQLKRAVERDGSDKAIIQAIINSQVSREKRLEAADDIIHNDADLNILRMQVRKLHQYYTMLASEG